jgi:hypothetical protein
MESPKDVAEFMQRRLKQDQALYQDVVVYEILNKFGEEFTYINRNGNLSIDKSVLQEFRKLTEGSVIWQRGEGAWRFRQDYDAPGRQQPD